LRRVKKWMHLFFENGYQCGFWGMSELRFMGLKDLRILPPSLRKARPGGGTLATGYEIGNSLLNAIRDGVLFAVPDTLRYIGTTRD
jgi:hypothetical protein